MAKIIDKNKTPKLIFFRLYKMNCFSYNHKFLKKIFNILIIICLFFSHQLLFGQNHAKKGLTTVVIDPGHGGKDPGSIGKNVYEKDVVLSIALKVGNYIKKYAPDVNVIYTRSTDVFIELSDRAEIANKNQADLFISIHANWNSKTTAIGTETFVMGYSKSEGNLDVARKENSVILLEDNYEKKYQGYDPNSAESYIIFSLVQNTFLTQSLSFAGSVQNQFSEKAQRFDRGVKQAGFLVLWRTTMPSVLVEVGFISNPQEEKFLMSENGQNIMASSIYRAFKNYKNQIENKSSESIQIPETANNYKDSTPKTSIRDNTEIVLPDTTNNAGNIDNKDSILFFLQILTSSKKIPLNSSKFKGIANVKEIYANNIYKYMAGNKKSYQEALDYSKIVKNYFPDAFIIATKNGKIIPVKDAIKEIKN